MRPPFPFSAIVGQDALKRALLLGVIQPGLGGVLIRGTKGVAKSTAVRALAHLLPPIETVAGCPFQRRPGETIAGWPMPESTTITRPVPLIELPLGATEDRVLGTLHLEKALRGERPASRACWRRPIAASSISMRSTCCRTTWSTSCSTPPPPASIAWSATACPWSHPARFLLVGTMNPEEGELRPQLLDRFGLVVDVDDLSEAPERAEAVRRRLAYEADPAGFMSQWQNADAAEANRIVAAQRLLPQVRASDALLHQASQLCLSAGVEGLRADLVLCQAAIAWAAYQGRGEVEPADLEQVAELALAHRRTRPPEPPPKSGERRVESREPETNRTDGIRPAGSIIEPIAGWFATSVTPPRKVLADSRARGRWASGAPGRNAVGLGTVVAKVDWPATVRAAAPYQVERGRVDGLLRLTQQDLRFQERQPRAGCLLFFVIDTSGSMAAYRRMRQTKSAVLALLNQAFRQRDQVALLAFRGEAAELVLPPTKSLRIARSVLERLPAGGTTPLAEGLAAAGRFVRRQRRLQPRRPVWTVILTDGRANVSSSRDPQREALAASAAARHAGRDPRHRHRNRLAALRRGGRAGENHERRLPGPGAGAGPADPRSGGRGMSKRRHGLVVVVTGDGKGKTTSSLGLAFRALGNGFRVFMLQYIKGKWKTGEKKLADLLRDHAAELGLDIEIRPMGDGFTWITQNREQDIATTREIWDVSKEAIASGKYDIVILDEINVVMKLGYLDAKEVVEFLKSKPADLHVVMTGRGAPAEVVDFADCVSEVKMIKHHYKAGVQAQQGIEF